MSIRKTFIATLAVAVAAAFSPLPELHAAIFNPDLQPRSDRLVQSIKMKKKGHKKTVKRKVGKHKKRGHRAASKSKRDK